MATITVKFHDESKTERVFDNCHGGKRGGGCASVRREGSFTVISDMSGNETFLSTYSIAEITVRESE